MFAAAIYLRYSMKDAKRPYRIGKKGNFMMWLIGGVGFLGSLTAFILSFFPPSQISMGSNTVWFSVLIGGTILFTVLPFVILCFKKPSWQHPGTEFVPFHWETSPEAVAARKQAEQEFEAQQKQS